MCSKCKKEMCWGCNQPTKSHMHVTDQKYCGISQTINAFYTLFVTVITFIKLYWVFNWFRFFIGILTTIFLYLFGCYLFYGLFAIMYVLYNDTFVDYQKNILNNSTNRSDLFHFGQQFVAVFGFISLFVIHYLASCYLQSLDGYVLIFIGYSSYAIYAGVILFIVFQALKDLFSHISRKGQTNSSNEKSNLYLGRKLKKSKK